MWLIYTLTRDNASRPHHVGVLGPSDKSDVEDAKTTLKIYGTAKTQEEAETHRDELRKQYELKERKPAATIVNVRCVTTGRVYASMSQAAKANHVSRGHLNRHLNNPAIHPTVKGLIFERIENE